MIKTAQRNRVFQPQLLAESPVRLADPRVRLVLSMGSSLAVMLSMERLLLFLTFYAAMLFWGRLARPVVGQLWRLKWALLFLFVVDWLVVDLNLAIMVTLRVILLASSFVFLVYTTTPGELRLVLEWLHLPARYAFSLSLAFQSLNLLAGEWQAIREAQQARGAWQPMEWSGWRSLPAQVRELVALTVPAIVLTTKRAWAMTEAAHARGFDAPHRRPYYQLSMGWWDWLLLVLVTAVLVAFLFLP
ncbi:MAG: energy-coupling factor transporter transmembrane protein EcfT [Ardenticatenaceae bacterium]|nr:energy-coupling factor transporter transmembrane protein EcfT [Ardenticatenaceae bacterium]